MRGRRWNRKGIETILATLLLVVIITVTSVIVYTWSLGVFGAALPAPPKGREILSFENAAFSPTNNNVTLYLRNTGTAITSLTSYYVSDLNGNEYARISWQGPTITPTSLGQVVILIPPACSGTNCRLTGTAFSFQSGNIYTITIGTARNNQFSFSILR